MSTFIECLAKHAENIHDRFGVYKSFDSFIQSFGQGHYRIYVANGFRFYENTCTNCHYIQYGDYVLRFYGYHFFTAKLFIERDVKKYISDLANSWSEIDRILEKTYD